MLAEEAAPVEAAREPQVQAERDVPKPEDEKGKKQLHLLACDSWALASPLAAQLLCLF